MARTSLLARSGLWRLTRHPVARHCYRRLDDAGVFLAQLDRFERPTTPVDRSKAESAQGPTVDVVPAREHMIEALGDATVAPSDRVLVARRDGRPLGWCLLSDRTVYVPELHRRLAFPGAYLWRLYVEPSERGAGIGTAIVRKAIAFSRATLEVPTITALVAPDNLPSRRAFTKQGFAPIERYTSGGWRGREFHRRRTVE
jgi:RimJ/RimL family protein N-acetyltransferase